LAVYILSELTGVTTGGIFGGILKFRRFFI
jgi:hypothetical protein